MLEWLCSQPYARIEIRRKRLVSATVRATKCTSDQPFHKFKGDSTGKHAKRRPELGFPLSVPASSMLEVSPVAPLCFPLPFLTRHGPLPRQAVRIEGAHLNHEQKP